MICKTGRACVYRSYIKLLDKGSKLLLTLVAKDCEKLSCFLD